MEADRIIAAVGGPDEAGIPQRVARLVERGDRHFELVRQAAVGQRRRHVDIAAHRRNARGERARHRPFRRVLEGPDIRDVGPGGADEALVLGVDIAERSVEADGRTGAGKIARKHCIGFGLDPLEARLGGVGGDAAEALHPADEAADRPRNLHIFIVHVETGEAERQAAIEQRSLVADFIAVDLFGVEGEEVVDIVIGAARRRGADRRRGARTARIETTALEALRIGGIDHIVRIGLEAQRGARGEFLEGALAAEIGRHRDGDRGQRAAELRRQAGDAVRLVDKGVAIVARVATADRQAELIGEIIGEIAEHRPGLGPHVARRIAVEAGQRPAERRRQRGARQAEQHVERRRGLRIEIIEAEEALQLVAFIKQLEFLADLLVAVDRGHVDVDRRQRVEVDRGEAAVLAPRADRTQRQRIGEICRDIHRQAIGPDVLLRIVEPGAGVIDIVEHRRAREEARDQAVAVARR